MFFNQSAIPKSIKLPFNWAADYFDGTYLTEYDPLTHKENKFYSINQANTIRFGLFGQNMKFFYEAASGSFFLNGRYLEIIYHDNNGQIHNLTNNPNQKDIITYKEAHTDINNKQGSQRTSTTSINFGYKTTYVKDDLVLNFQPVVSLPFNKSTFIEIKLTSNKTIDGDLVFYCRGKEVERFHTPLTQSMSGQINWTIKC